MPQDDQKNDETEFLFASPHHHKHGESECGMDIYIYHFG